MLATLIRIRLYIAPRNQPFVLWKALWAFVGLGFIVASIVLSSTISDPENRTAFLTLCGSLALACAAIPSALWLIVGWFTDWAAETDSFVECGDELPSRRFITSLGSLIACSRGATVTGILWGITSVLLVRAATLSNGWSANWGVEATANVVIFTSEFVAGAAVYTLYGIGGALRRLGSLPQCRVTVTHGKYGILGLGTLLLKCSTIVLALWLLFHVATLQLVLSDEFTLVDAYAAPNLWVISLVPLFVILSGLVWCQLPLHSKMVAYKRKRIHDTRELLRQVERRETVTEDTTDRLIAIRKRLADEESLPEWPWTLNAKLGAAALPLVWAGSTVVLESFVRRIFQAME